MDPKQLSRSVGYHGMDLLRKLGEEGQEVSSSAILGYMAKNKRSASPPEQIGYVLVVVRVLTVL